MPYYHDVAYDYVKKGWKGVLPLPREKKFPPPKGFTGNGNPDPTDSDIVRWWREYPKGNVALRMPEGIIGIDVDDYGKKKGAYSLRELVDELGPLPATWSSTARHGSWSGHRFFRVPEGTKFKGNPKPGIEIIQRGHRYAVVWPSWNPDADAFYCWYTPSGELSETPPSVEDLPELPEAWVEGLKARSGDYEGVGDAHLEGPGDLKDATGFRQLTEVYVQRAKEGGCHDTAKDFAVQLRDNGCPFDDAYSVWARVFFENTEHDTDRDGWSLAEVQKAVIWAYESPSLNRTPLPNFSSVDPVLQAFADRVTAGEPVSEATLREIVKLRASREANRILDAEEMAEARGPRVRRTAREYALLPQPDAIINSVLAAEVNLLGGPSEGGKSLLARDWSLAVASGVSWQGFEVARPRSVLWIASEGLHDFGDRWTAQPLWEQAADRVLILDEPVNLVRSTEDVTWLLDEYGSDDVGLVVFDVIYGMGLSDDNNTKDVVPLISTLKRISAQWKCATLAIGHTGHGEGRRFRGSSSWRQLAAVEWHLSEGRLTCEKSKIAEKSKLERSARVDYPHLHVSNDMGLGVLANRNQLVLNDIEHYPSDSQSKRAERLAGPMGLSVERCRAVVRGVINANRNDE